MSNVFFYSGNKLNQTPRKIIKNGETIDVYLFEERLMENIITKEMERIFIVYDKNGEIYKIRSKNERYFVDCWK